MSFSDLFGTGEHQNNLAHFAAIVNLAAADGQINSKEEVQLRKLADKLDIQEEEYLRLLKSPGDFPEQTSLSNEQRLERLHDLFSIIYADHEIDEIEESLLKKYAIALGYSYSEATRIIRKSKIIFGGNISFEDYQLLVKR